MRQLFTVCCTLLFCDLFAQANQNQFFVNDPSNIGKLSSGGIYYTSNTHHPGIEGSPYLFPGWKDAMIVNDKGDTATTIQVLYDASVDKFEGKSGQTVGYLDKNRVRVIIVGKEKFSLINKGYYLVLAEGKYTLLKKYRAVKQKPTYNPALNSGSRNESWSIEDSYFLLKGNDLVPVKLTKKSITDALSLDKSSQELVKEKGLSFTKEEHVVQLIQHLNQATFNR
jgi:hypothetical protein